MHLRHVFAGRIALASCRAGARKKAYQDAPCRAGIISEATRIPEKPEGLGSEAGDHSARRD
jgi:hypothetical protein